MSTDPTQPLRAPAPPPEEPQADAPAAAPQAAPPTVQAPAVKAPTPQEPPTQAVPKWQAPPPPPPPGPQNRPQPPTSLDPAPPTQWDRPPQRPQSHQPQPQPPPQQPPQQQWQQPRPWTEPQPWIEPQDNRRGQWPPQPAQPPQPPVNQPPPDQQPRFRRRQRKRRVRRSVMALFTVIVLLILLVIGDRVALAVTENDMASQFQQNGLPVKPSVNIEGFPFLTQLAAKDFNQVDISANNVPVPLPTGGNLTITSINATINGLHISSYSSTASARVDQMHATAFVSFDALTAAGGIANGTGLTVTPVGNNTVKISANLGGIVSDTEEAKITTTGPQTISVKVLPSNSLLGSVLNSFGSFSFNLPKGVPPSLKITKLTLNSQGLTVSAAASNATFSQ